MILGSVSPRRASNAALTNECATPSTALLLFTIFHINLRLWNTTEVWRGQELH
jgi:hypothetical protein